LDQLLDIGQNINIGTGYWQFYKMYIRTQNFVRKLLVKYVQNGRHFEQS